MKKAFTLIELLVVIAVIALLSTLSVVALSNARAKSRDARRLSDIKQIQTALEMYLDDAGIYPASLPVGSQIAYGNSVFLTSIPGDPMGGNQYNYAQTESGHSYTLDFILETKSADYEPGNYQATPKGVLAGGSGLVPSFVCGDKLIDGSYQYGTASESGYCYMTQSLKRDSNHRRCYNNDPGLCESNGGLYDYGHSDNICPTGWRLPSTDETLFIQLADQSGEGFIGYYNSKESSYKNDTKYIMLDSADYVLDVGSQSVVAIPWPDSAVSVRCIKDPS